MLISIRNLYQVRQRIYHIQERICTHIHSFPVIVLRPFSLNCAYAQIPQRIFCLRMNATKSRQGTHINKAKNIYIRGHRKQGLNCTLHQKNLVYIKIKQTSFLSKTTTQTYNWIKAENAIYTYILPIKHLQFNADLETTQNVPEGHTARARAQRLGCAKQIGACTWKYFLGFLSEKKNQHYRRYIWNAILKSLLHTIHLGFDRSFGIHKTKPNLHAIKFLRMRATRENFENCPLSYGVYYRHCIPVGTYQATAATTRRLARRAESVGPFVPIWVYFDKYKDYINLSEFICQIRQHLTVLRSAQQQSLGDVIQTRSISSHFVPFGHISDFRKLVYAKRNEIARHERSLSGLELTQKESPTNNRRSERQKSSYKIDCVLIETSTTGIQKNVSLEMHLGSLRDPRSFDWQSDLLSSQSVCTHIQTRACARFPSWNKHQNQQPKGLRFWRRTSCLSEVEEIRHMSDIGKYLHNGPKVPNLGKSYVEKGFGRKNHGFDYEGFVLASFQSIFFSNPHSTFLSLASSQLQSPFSYIWSKDPRLVRKSLRTFCFRSKPVVNMILKQHYSKAHNASLLVQNLSRFVIAFLKRNKGSKNKLQQLKNIAYKILLSLAHQNRCLGVGFSFSGRVYGARKASSLKMLFGSVPFNTLEANMDYSKIMQKTRNGTWGFQTWLHLKQKKHINFLAHSQCEREYLV